jgi:hypothetical protein
MRCFLPGVIGWLGYCLYRTTQYYVYDYQGKRVRTVTKSNHQVQSRFGEFVKGIVVIPI